MKKMTVMILTVAIAMSVGSTAFAAPSVQGGSDGYGAGLSDDNTDIGDDVWVEWNEFVEGENLRKHSEETQELIKYINNLEKGVSVKKAFEDFNREYETKETDNILDEETILVFDTESDFVQEGFEYLDQMYFLSPMRDLVFYNIEPTPEKLIKVDFHALDLTDDMDVYVLYRCDTVEKKDQNGRKAGEKHGWELLEAERTGEEQDKQVTACFHDDDSIAGLVYIDKSVKERTEGTSPRT